MEEKKVNEDKQYKENKIIETNNLTIERDSETGHKIINDFYFEDIIGRGAYAKVKKCKNLKTKEEFAVKILNKYLMRKKKKSFGKANDGSLLIHYMIEDAINEMQTYKALSSRHPNILSLYQILNNDETDKTYLIMELVEKGPMATVDENSGVFTLNPNYDNNAYDEKLIKKWILDIASGIKFLHDNDICHCDVKPDNILIDKDGHCKLADFGSSVIIDKKEGDCFTKTEGNIYFFPPEFCDEEKDKKFFAYKPVDIWALGVSIYTCIFKCLPFFPRNRENIMDLFEEISSAKVDLNRNGIKISEELRNLLSHIFEKDPEKRYTANDIVNDPWLNEK